MKKVKKNEKRTKKKLNESEEDNKYTNNKGI